MIKLLSWLLVILILSVTILSFIAKAIYLIPIMFIIISVTVLLLIVCLIIDRIKTQKKEEASDYKKY
jgi:uncharacterized membrane protein